MGSKSGSTVKKQHYVWRGYLKQWTPDLSTTGRTYVYRKHTFGNQAEIQEVQLTEIGFQKYFYDVSGFTDKDLSIVVQLLNHMMKGFPYSIKLRKDEIEKARSQRDYIEHILCDYENIESHYHFLERLINKDYSFYKNSKAEDAMAILQEEILQRIFGGGKRNNAELADITVQALDELIQGMNNQNDNGFDEKYEFLRYFCMQYMRSPKVYYAQVANLEAIKKNAEGDSKTIEDLSDKLYAFALMIYFAETMAYNLSTHFHTWIELIENRTSTPFVTADVPIVSLNGSILMERNEFYYPISPKVAIKLCASHITHREDFEKRNLKLIFDDEDQVHYFNRMIANNCVNEVFSADKDVLMDIKAEHDDPAKLGHDYIHLLVRDGNAGKAGNNRSSADHDGSDNAENFGNADCSYDEVAIIADFNLDEMSYEFLISFEKNEIVGFSRPAFDFKGDRKEMNGVDSIIRAYKTASGCSDEELEKLKRNHKAISGAEMRGRLEKHGVLETFIKKIQEYSDNELINRVVFDLEI